MVKGWSIRQFASSLLQRTAFQKPNFRNYSPWTTRHFWSNTNGGFLPRSFFRQLLLPCSSLLSCHFSVTEDRISVETWFFGKWVLSFVFRVLYLFAMESVVILALSPFTRPHTVALALSRSHVCGSNKCGSKNWPYWNWPYRNTGITEHFGRQLLRTFCVILNSENKCIANLDYTFGESGREG